MRIRSFAAWRTWYQNIRNWRRVYAAERRRARLRSSSYLRLEPEVLETRQVLTATLTGALDVNFDGDGIRTLPSTLGTDDTAHDAAQQADGKLVVVTVNRDGTSSMGPSKVTRYNVDGSVDTTFGTGGTVTFGNAVRLSNVEIQADGKIVVAGESSTSLYLARITAGGTLDTTFGSAGSTTIAHGNNSVSTYPVGLAVQSDGKIVATKQANLTNFAVIRTTSTGALDTTFNGIGYYNLDLGGDETAHEVLLQADGKILVAGTTYAASNADYFAVRLTTGGVLDTTYNASGIVKVNVAAGATTYDEARAAVLQSDGKLIVAGTADRFGVSDFGLIRLNTDGTLDTSFGTGGKQISDLGGSGNELYGVAVQADGKIVVGGTVSYDFTLARFTTTGALDTTFDGDGKQTLDLNSLDSLKHVLVQADGKIVIVGATESITSGAEALIARFNAAGALDTTFNGVGYRVHNFGLGSSIATAIAALPDGRFLVAGFLPEDG